MTHLQISFDPALPCFRELGCKENVAISNVSPATSQRNEKNAALPGDMGDNPGQSEASIEGPDQSEASSVIPISCLIIIMRLRRRVF